MAMQFAQRIEHSQGWFSGIATMEHFKEISTMGKHFGSNVVVQQW
jgi:hypothetical protein